MITLARFIIALAITIGLTTIAASEGNTTDTIINMLGVLGAVLNMIVVLANGLKMPVRLEADEEIASKNSVYIPMDSQSKLPWLADRFSFLSLRFSIGDAVILTCVLLTVISIFSS